jgi:transposase
MGMNANVKSRANRRTSKRYSREFKRQALEKLQSGEYTFRQLAKELGVSVVSLVNWRQQQGGSAAASAQSEQSEIERLRAEIAELKEERDRLRRGIAYLTGVID